MNQDGTEKLTLHAMLVIWGQFAQCLGLPQAFEKVSLRQKTVTHSPQTKVLEFLVAMLGGLAHLKDISRSAHPLDQDQEVARAWGQPAWADYSGVSRTLAGLSRQEAEQITRVLDEISQPIIDREVFLTQQQVGKVIYDGDLTGRPISNRSTTYPGAAYGHMDDGLSLGYQAAMVSMHSPTYGRLWLSVEPHPGNHISSKELQAMVAAAEHKTKTRPLRRIDLLDQRLAALAARHQVLMARVDKVEQAWAAAQVAQQTVEEQLQHWQQQVASYEARYAVEQRVERPHSPLAQARHKVAVYTRRQARRVRDVEKARCRLLWRQNHVTDAQAEIERLQTRRAQFECDNASNATPIQAEFRLDAGFGTQENIAYLIEMGYEVYTKPLTSWLKNQLLCLAEKQANWATVSANAEMVAWAATRLDDFPYPLDLALERFHTSKGLGYSVLVHFGNTPAAEDLPGWFHHYNGRQIIEAAIKEGKRVFQMHHLKVRAPAALYLQEHFAAFAANFVRWAAPWLIDQNTQLPDTWHNPADLPVKGLVTVAAHTSAYVTWFEQGCLLRFTSHSVFAGRSFSVKREWAFQLVLPFTQTCLFSSV